MRSRHVMAKVLCQRRRIDRASRRIGAGLRILQCLTHARRTQMSSGTLSVPCGLFGWCKESRSTRDLAFSRRCGHEVH